MLTETPPLETLRLGGWVVAVHNDYKQDGKPHTFWLFTHPCGLWIKGEGETDEKALEKLPAEAHQKILKFEKLKRLAAHAARFCIDTRNIALTDIDTFAKDPF